MVFSDFGERYDILHDNNPSAPVEHNADDFDEPYDPLGDARPSIISTISYRRAASAIDHSSGFSDDDMRDMLVEQVNLFQKKEIEAMLSLSPSSREDKPTHIPRFVVFRLPYFEPEPCEWDEKRQSSSSVQYISTYDPHTLPFEVPLGTLLPDGVLSCRPCLICCTVLSKWLHPIDLLCQLLEQRWCAAELECGFRAPFPLSHVQVENIRVAHERTILPDLESQPVTGWGSLLDHRRTGFMSFLVRKSATGIVRKSVTGPVTISGHQSIDIGRSPKPKLSSPTSLATSDSISSFTTAISTHDMTASMSPSGYRPANPMETVRENERPAPGLSAPLAKLHDDYYTTLRQQKIIQPFDKELNWSGKGQHVTFTAQDAIPLSPICHLGSSPSATVDKVLCRRIALARKTMRCNRTWTVSDALREVYHLQNLRHVHIVQLVGTYLQNRDFSILMYPAADSHLGTFLEETTDMQDTCRKDFLASTLGCLASAVAFIHERTTKHMDIKPRNILVRSDGSWWRIYLTDFGLSRSFAPQDHSQSDGWTSRTVRYCSPEVFAFDARGRAADVFSLGCVFLEITCVIAKMDLQEFVDARRGGSDDISFHANLDRIVNWARTSLFSSLLRSQGSKSESRALEKVICLQVIGLQIKMISLVPSMRPTAAEVRSRLASFPRSMFSPTTCCTSPPELYEVYKPASPVSQGS